MKLHVDEKGLITGYSVFGDETTDRPEIAEDKLPKDFKNDFWPGKWVLADGLIVLSGNEKPEPKPLPNPMEDLQQENSLLKAQVQALADRNDFVDDCIAELAMLVYG
jgi:hypothetical protein